MLLQRWPEFFAETTFLTDRFHGVNHLCSDEFKYNTHGLKGREEFPGPDNSSVSEQINKLMMIFDKTQQRATINTGMLVYNSYILEHNTNLVNKWPKKKAMQVRPGAAWTSTITCLLVSERIDVWLQWPRQTCSF
jgi:hypothetical protein